MNQTLFADSAYWLAPVWPSDIYHQSARSWHRRITDRGLALVTTDAVLLETLNAFRAPPARAAAVRLFRSIHADPRMTVLAASGPLLAEGFRLFAGRLDKSWSLVDCISFVVMQHRQLTQALTSDHHFEQAGFIALLRGGGASEQA